MPTYSYQCQSCGNIIDISQKMSDTTLKKCNCDKCKKESNVKRIIRGGSGMIFKGSGFYLTDYTEYGKSPKNPNKDLKEKKDKNNSDKD